VEINFELRQKYEIGETWLAVVLNNEQSLFLILFSPLGVGPGNFFSFLFVSTGEIILQQADNAASRI